jgi:hypothetical protein
VPAKPCLLRILTCRALERREGGNLEATGGLPDRAMAGIWALRCGCHDAPRIEMKQSPSACSRRLTLSGQDQLSGLAVWTNREAQFRRLPSRVGV